MGLGRSFDRFDTHHGNASTAYKSLCRRLGYGSGVSLASCTGVLLRPARTLMRASVLQARHCSCMLRNSGSSPHRCHDLPTTRLCRPKSQTCLHRAMPLHNAPSSTFAPPLHHPKLFRLTSRPRWISKFSFHCFFWPPTYHPFEPSRFCRQRHGMCYSDGL